MSRENRRKKITLTQEELDALVGIEVARYSVFQTDMFVCAIALALNAEYGFGRERNLRALERVLAIVDSMCDNPEALEHNKQLVHEKFGITTSK